MATTNEYWKVCAERDALRESLRATATECAAALDAKLAAEEQRDAEAMAADELGAMLEVERMDADMLSGYIGDLTDRLSAAEAREEQAMRVLEDAEMMAELLLLWFEHPPDPSDGAAVFEAGTWLDTAVDIARQIAAWRDGGAG